MKDPKRHKRRMVAPATRPAKPVVTVDTYREDPLYLRIRRIEAEILQDGRVVAPVDVLVRMDLLVPLEHSQLVAGSQDLDLERARCQWS
jgi:hypothetical protein